MNNTLLKNERFEKTLKIENAVKYFQEKLAYEISAYELVKLLNEEYIQVIDVRAREDYTEFHIQGALSIPVIDLKHNLARLSKDKINVVYCYDQNCRASSFAALILAENGYPVMELHGGFAAWNQKSFPIDKCKSC
ncbi:MAG: rhodanese-like domain-containing protein [Cyanobacteriota bacterium]